MSDLAQVLVVEDEDDIRNLVVMNLKRAGFGVLDAADGAAGLALAKEHQSSEAIEDARDGADPPGKIRALILSHHQISDHRGP